MSGTEYYPRKGDIVTLNFDPSTGTEIRKRRPALVLSNSKYAELTGLAVVCPITSAENNRLRSTNLMVPLHQAKTHGFVNPLQLHSFDFHRRKVHFVERAKSSTLDLVLQTVGDILCASES